MAESAAWTRLQRGLHWWTAGLVPTGFALGFLMVGTPLQELLLKFLLYQAHKTIGLTVLALTAARLLRALRGRPRRLERLPDWQHRAAPIMHAVLYGLLLVTPVLGYFTAATAPARIPTLFLLVVPVPHMVGADAAWFGILRLLHLGCAITLMVLAAMHAVAAVHHHVRGRAVLIAMWRG
ncbi:MAG TPA: cytochrome b/b6 domain-containing protein [Acetobacteraceae bacterium]|nr:cytochrome b/b6 domain-containing protein [Acetobacteraceae bacterium]